MSAPDPIATTPRLVLTPWRLDDADAIAALWLDPDAMRYAGALTAPADVRRALTAARAAQDTHGVCLWAVRARDDGRLLGDCGFHVIGDGSYELGYHFLPAAQGRGHATEAARAALDHAFAALGAREVLAWSHPDNVRSVALLGRCGFAAEGPDPAERGELRFRLTAEGHRGRRREGSRDG
ncbi:MAG: GNAT family N-acetyltransferase [bacterium]